MTEEADVVIVVGSKNSSNSRRLRELAEAGGVPAYLVDGPTDIDPNRFHDMEAVLVTAGASAPENVVENCVRFISDRFGASVESSSSKSAIRMMFRSTTGMRSRSQCSAVSAIRRS